MRPSQVIALLLMLAASPCFGFEVVLNNGKVLTGDVLREDPETLILRDLSGVRLNIKKDTIDWARTQDRNKKTEEAHKKEKEPTGETDLTDPQQPKRKTRVYKKEDLENMPELTILGNEESPDDEEIRNEFEDRAMREKEAEGSWNEEALRIDDQIREAKDIYQNSKRLCDKVIPGVEDLREGDYVRLSPEQYEERRRYACSEAESAAKELKNAETEYEELLEEARKKGIPPGWVDPARIRN